MVIAGAGLHLRAEGEAVAITPEWVDRLLAEARERSPALQAAQAQTEAAEAAVSAVRSWDDPTASFGIWTAPSGGFSASDEGNLVYGLDQKLPLHDRPNLKRKVAAAGAAGDRLAAGEKEQQLRRDLYLALDRLALAGREAELAEQDIAWLGATVDAVDHRYRAGQASQVDWLKVQTARAMAGDDLITREQDREHSAFALNRLLNRELHASWPRLSVPEARRGLAYTPELVEAALAAEPRLRVLREQSASAQAEADLTRSARLPDVSVGLQAWQYSGDGGLRQAMATVSFSVPWLNRGRYDEEWRRDRERKRASDLAAEDYALAVRETLHHHVLDLDASRRQALLYRDRLIPLTEQTLASTEAAWERGLGPFADVLEAHRMLLDDQRALARALTDQANMWAEVGYLTGGARP